MEMKKKRKRKYETFLMCPRRYVKKYDGTNTKARIRYDGESNSQT